MIRAVLDVNVLLSAIIGPLGFSRQVVLAWQAGHFVAISSAGILSELAEKLALPRIQRRYRVESPQDILWLQALLANQAELILVPPEERLPITGDPEDDYVLATARLAEANYLVTGDHGLLALGQYGGAQIVTPKAFVQLLEQP